MYTWKTIIQNKKNWDWYDMKKYVYMYIYVYMYVYLY